MELSLTVLEKLQQFDTPTICNVIELFDVRPRHTGFMDGRIKCQFPEFPPMVGLAVTASFRSNEAPQSSDAYGSLQEQLTIMESFSLPSIVVFQDIDSPAVGATFGEVMCSTYKAFGSAGLITSGGGRDLIQVKQIGFPVFTGSTICSHAYCRILNVGASVHVGGMAVTTGDLLHGDENGVTSIPIEIAAEVADISDEFIQAERFVLDYVQSDETKTIEEFTKRSKEMSDAVSKLRSRVSRNS